MKSILVVEDDHDTRVVLREALEHAGYFTFTATNGIDGLALLRQIKEPCIIILDRAMPLMDGDEFLKIRARDPKIAHIPVIMLTAHPPKAPPPGLLDFFTKPVDLNKLLDLVENHCRELS